MDHRDVKTKVSSLVYPKVVDEYSDDVPVGMVIRTEPEKVKSKTWGKP